jgi:hypothetical protein
MTAPAISAALDALVATVEAIAPTIDAATPFRRRAETSPGTTRGGKRWVNLEFDGHPRDLSNEGAGVQSPGLADRSASVRLLIDYPLARNERALETTMAVDSELLLRALGRSASWTGTPVRRVVARTTVDRSAAVPFDRQGTGKLVLVVTADVQYRDVE